MNSNMKKFIYELLSSKCSLSSMRFIAITSTFIAGCLAAYGICHGSDLYGLATLCGVFLGIGVAGKVSQKKTEK